MRRRYMRPSWPVRALCRLSVMTFVGVLGCKDLTGSQALPSGTNDPAFYHTPAGARGMYTAALYQLEQALPGYILDTGVLTDELQANPSARTSLGPAAGGSLDERILPELTTGPQTGADDDYAKLQAIRGSISQALGALVAYDTVRADTATVKGLRAELFSLNGYAELLLADFYCSGVPLSTFDFEGDFTYHAQSTRDQVYRDAEANEDSAIALADASSRVRNLAYVLRGRALLGLGDFAAAADDVAIVPDEFQYQLALNWNNTGDAAADLLHSYQDSLSDREGINGLPFLSSHDPRTTATAGFPDKYRTGLLTGGFSPFTVADGIEARLIQAEGALHAGTTGAVTAWLTTLNALRTSGSTLVPVPASTIVDTAWVTGCADQPDLCTDSVPQGTSYAGYTIVDTYTVDVPVGSPAYNVCWADAGSTAEECSSPYSVVVYGRPASTDTIYTAGTGGVGGLAPLSDPGATLSGSAADSARVALMFRERAFWLYLTGHRQGDLRRLLRQYSNVYRSQDQVYPTGLYAVFGTGEYGTAVTAPISTAERVNPLFHGCLDRAP